MSTPKPAAKSKASMLPRILKSLEAEGKFEKNDPVLILIGDQEDKFKRDVANDGSDSCVWDMVYVKNIEDNSYYNIPFFEDRRRFLLVDCPGVTGKAAKDKEAMVQLGETLDACLAAGALISGVLVIQNRYPKALEWSVFERILDLIGEKNIDLVTLAALQCSNMGKFYNMINDRNEPMNEFPLEPFTELLDRGASIVTWSNDSTSFSEEVFVPAFSRGIARGASSLAEFRQRRPEAVGSDGGEQAESGDAEQPHGEQAEEASAATAQADEHTKIVNELESTISALRFKLRENDRRISLERQAERRAHEQAIQKLQAELEDTKKLLAASQSTERYLMQKLGNVSLDSSEEL